ncbi:hypothetical protein BCCH1_59190 [Burkholderia contaminans]|uniref:Uncharacterized protein n=1 Tax=Burkholderia contaminans TaxID=488447 RepID=A0A250LHU6_9BURK|nr:hypothetical protein BCCH1_59190 [Burkholderia contaminans]GLZ69946.1 hypothetical protein Bcon01_29910 [Burkholderia contaminans]
MPAVATAALDAGSAPSATGDSAAISRPANRVDKVRFMRTPETKGGVAASRDDVAANGACNGAAGTTGCAGDAAARAVSARGRVRYGTGGGQACRSDRRGRMRVFIGGARQRRLLMLMP